MNQHEQQDVDALLPDDRYSALQSAVRADDVAGVMRLVSRRDTLASMLPLAVMHGDLDVLNALVQHGAEVNSKDRVGQTALMHAAVLGRADVVAALLRYGAGVNAEDENGKTALAIAASWGRASVIAELARHGANVNAVNDDGETALMLTAYKGHVDAAAELLRLGADVDVTSVSDETALIAAARSGHAGVATELLQHGADMDSVDACGNDALTIAVQRGHSDVVSTLMQHSTFDQLSPSDDIVALFVAAAMGDVYRLRELVAKDVDVDFAVQDGMTALYYAAEYGHTDAVQFLLDSGADVTTKAFVSDSPLERECETPLTLAGRNGHMQTFEALVRAGASVSVRSSADGETPLISVARFDNFPAVSLLVAHGNGTGVLCFGDVQDDEYPLLPGTLATMETMCAAVALEFEPVCARMLTQLQTVCSALQQRQDTTAVPSDHTPPPLDLADALVTFAYIVYRTCRLLFDIEVKDSALSRFVASRPIQRRINDIDDELSSLAYMHGLTLDEAASTKSAWLSDDSDDSLPQLQQQVQTRFELALSSDDALIGDDDDSSTTDATYAMAVLLQYELALRRQEQSPHAHASVVEAVLTRFLHVNAVEQAPDVPSWFVARDDLEYHSWNRAAMNNSDVERFDGKWRSTNVTIETSCIDVVPFQAAVSQWHALNHPNVVKLFGACHISSPKLVVYESITDALSLHEFLQVNKSNRALKWKLLYDAALGLQHLHARGVVHGSLQTDAIVIGSNLVAKLRTVIGSRSSNGRRNNDNRASVHWLSPELVRHTSAPCLASDIYALGMCVWEAVALQLPWRGLTPQDINTKVWSCELPERPANSMRDSEWLLINDMCASDSMKRIDIAHVGSRLKQFMLEHEQVLDGTTSNSPSSPRPSGASSTEIESPQHLDKHYFGELGATIPNTLVLVKERCEKLSGDEQWMFANVLPALEFVFGQLQAREMSPSDAEVKMYIDVLGRLQRFVRTAVSDKSVYQQIRSRKAAQAHRLVYAELDRMLDMLCVPKEHTIRVWRRLEVASSIAGFETLSVVGNGAEDSTSNPITIHHLDTIPAIYEQWTRDGLVKAAASESSDWRPSWYLSLRELVFSEVDKIGQGAFGAVYKGKWLDTQVVIKFMGYENDFDTISTDLLLHEVRVWHRLNHPHVLKLYGACHVDKRYFVCELASGGDLVDYLNKQPDNMQLKWQKLHEAALGLQYLHSVGVAHNDLKCDNIMVGADGRAKLIDFGLSCLLGEAEIQIAMKNIGAVNWRSPEYLAGERPSFASDVYSFAMCIIEAVSGEWPWGKSMLSTMVKFQVKKGRTPTLPPTMTLTQRNLIERMTTHDPTERVSMTFVVNKLHEIANDKRVGQAA